MLPTPPWDSLCNDCPRELFNVVHVSDWSQGRAREKVAQGNPNGSTNSILYSLYCPLFEELDVCAALQRHGWVGFGGSCFQTILENHIVSRESS